MKELSYRFAVNTIKLCRNLQMCEKEYILSRQLSKSGTSIGANVEEASGAQSSKDFIAKFHIALKEAKESHYWLRLLKDTQLISSEVFEEQIKILNHIINLITKSLKTAKENVEKE